MEAGPPPAAHNMPSHWETTTTPLQAHLVGMAGSGMRALAEVLAGWGWRLSGSDCRVDEVKVLAKLGINLYPDHAPGHLPHDAHLVIHSDAVPANNPELRRAAELGIPTLSYFQMLGRLTADRCTLAVAGTHGKSTVTAMLAHILTQAGQDPTVFCGAAPLGRITGGRAGRDGLALVEACEYRANFLHLRPHLAAVLNIEPDHFDCYNSLKQIEDAFRRFVGMIPPDGFLLVRHECPSSRRATTDVSCHVESFGLCAEADWAARIVKQTSISDELNAVSGGCFTFEIKHVGRSLGEASLRMPGLHNVLNALAAAALAWQCGATAEQISAALSSFAGLHRRMELIGTWRGVTVVDDYAHHPTEVTAALTTVRQMYPGRRLWCVFQPHQASRTKRLMEQFAASLRNADKVLVADIFRAREGDPQPGEVTATDLAREISRLDGHVLPGCSETEIKETLQAHLAPGDVLVTLGAGNLARFRPASF